MINIQETFENTQTNMLGLALGGVMGYVCNRDKCPTGLGGVRC
jgi:hypothetical protein